jgi:undecaprenyl pyrophosphate phosphatase UppP
MSSALPSWRVSAAVVVAVAVAVVVAVVVAVASIHLFIRSFTSDTALCCAVVYSCVLCCSVLCCSVV